MRKSTLFMLILLLTLAWGCSGETETGTDTTESTTEMMDTGSEVIDPPEMPEEQEEPGEHGDISAVPLEINRPPSTGLRLRWSDLPLRSRLGPGPGTQIHL